MSRPSSSVTLPRILIGTFISTTIFLPSIYSPILTSLYTWLFNSRVYNCSLFETGEILLLYAFIEPIYTYRFARNPYLRIDFRPEKSEHNSDSHASRLPLPRLKRPTKRLLEIGKSIFPLATLDLILIKKYAGVPVPDIRRSGGYDPLPAGRGRIKSSFLAPTLHRFSSSSPLQFTRALPRDVPSSRRIILELMVAFFIYDTLFFLIHIAFHRIPSLRRIHHPHHTHSEINPQVTNQLNMIERLSLILLANFSLNIIGSHVLTRTLFVPVFVYLLVEIHCGMDLDWGYEKIIPFGLGAGCRKHAMHHRLGEGNFQQFFCWWDDGLVLAERWLKDKK
ncbi:hypothetical protein DL98DRAFT_602332 [Cadophora sp. DSE1049]|nr:hypothetical protein DL98DRAFT_602332 [Cadophora sp. DSE1049]